MSRGTRVVVIASGATEREALPHLLRDLIAGGTELLEVRIPPGHQLLDTRRAEALIKAAWYSRSPDEQPDKFVVLVDADRGSIEGAEEPFRKVIDAPPVPATVLVCAAKWHLEAWFFADSGALRSVIGRDLGKVVPAVPDDIEDPKRRLASLLGDLYTAELAGRIAKAMRPGELQKSPSFTRFEAAVRNGSGVG